MVQEQTILKVADNSGAKVVRCFRVLGGSRRRYAKVGDMIVASVQTADPLHKNKPVKKKDVIKAVVVRTKHATRRKDGSYVRFDENAAVIIDDKKQPVGTRIFGPIPREVREKGFDRIVTMAQEIV